MDLNTIVYKITQRDDIQIYRGIAVISVLLYHFDPNIFKYGYLGVDVFCSPQLCEYYSDSHYFYIDHIHFGYYGAKKNGNHFVNNFLDISSKKS